MRVRLRGYATTAEALEQHDVVLDDNERIVNVSADPTLANPLVIVWIANDRAVAYNDMEDAVDARCKGGWSE